MMCSLSSADYLYICHSYLEVCKLNECAESLLVLSEIDDGLDGSAHRNLIISPIKRFADAVLNVS